VDRKELLQGVKKVVVKIGTAALSSPDGGLDEAKVARLAEQVHLLRKRGLRVVVVSSGAIGAGMNALDIRRRPAHLPELQACAAVGQGRLTAVYDQCFRRHGYHAAQILLTRDDFNDRSRYLNASNTIHAILDYGAVPIINENDTISVEEIGFGENDGLAALVTNLVSANLLILLTVVDGLYENPDAPAEARRAIPLVPKVTDEIRALADGSRSRGGRGGMVSKLEAAGVATNAGALALIANALQPRALERIFDGEELGTLFLPAKARRMARRKSWIRFGSRPKGTLVVDAGARRALVEGGKSLLPSGIVRVEGEFDAGGMVAVCDETGAEFARGLANYGAADMRRILGLKTAAIHGLFGDHAYDEAIHRDHLVLNE
jgi:glutamate 5-kinase